MGVFRNPHCHCKSIKIFAEILNKILFLTSHTAWLKGRDGKKHELSSVPCPNHCIFPRVRCFRITVTEYGIQVIFKTTAIRTLEPKSDESIKGSALWHPVKSQLNVIRKNFNLVIGNPEIKLKPQGSMYITSCSKVSKTKWQKFSALWCVANKYSSSCHVMPWHFLKESERKFNLIYTIFLCPRHLSYKHNEHWHWDFRITENGLRVGWKCIL